MTLAETKRRGWLTPEKKREIVRLRVEDRLSSIEIAARMNSNTTTVCALVKPYPLSADEIRARKARTTVKMRKALIDGGSYIGGSDWSPAENARLAKLWPLRTRERLCAEFHPRSWEAISRQASKLGIRRSRTANRTTKKKQEVDPFFQALRDIREARGITRDELADRAGFHRIHFARVELGTSKPSWFVVRAWLDALSFDIQPIPKNASELARGRKQWLIDEESTLAELLAQGSTIQEAAMVLKRPASEIEKHARTLGLLESEATRNVSGMTRLRLGR